MWREHAQGKELSRSFERKADAERHLVDMQHRVLTGTYAPPRLGGTPFSEAALRYRQRGNWRPRTHRTVEERLRYAIAHLATGRSPRSARAMCSHSSAVCRSRRTLCGS